MKSFAADLHRLDVAAAAKARAALDGHLPLAAMDRLTGSTQAPADGQMGNAEWSVQGLWQQPTGGEPEIRLRLQIRASVHLTCQRCLQPVAQALTVDRTIRFVPGEDQAAQLDEEVDEDVLALPRALDLPALIEDELILALPIVPMHDECPEPLVFDAEAAGEAADDGMSEPHPFAALAALKKRGQAG